MYLSCVLQATNDRISTYVTPTQTPERNIPHSVVVQYRSMHVQEFYLLTINSVTVQLMEPLLTYDDVFQVITLQSQAVMSDLCTSCNYHTEIYTGGNNREYQRSTLTFKRLIQEFPMCHGVDFCLFDRTAVAAAEFVCYTGVLISPQPYQEGNKLQRRKILSFIYAIYKHNWKNISIYIYIYIYIYILV